MSFVKTNGAYKESVMSQKTQMVDKRMTINLNYSKLKKKILSH